MEIHLAGVHAVMNYLQVFPLLVDIQFKFKSDHGADAGTKGYMLKLEGGQMAAQLKGLLSRAR
ncbi:MAG: hypothetical protein CM15mP83_6790 [Flavobacteriaceae bacterium]|nr:MAG: hypothetical protein CM15mP83_6790 [Flavobacteriaceae bacterium]